MSKHYHINKNDCRNDNRPVLGDKSGLIEYISHHQINGDTNHGRMCQHDSSSIVRHWWCCGVVLWCCCVINNTNIVNTAFMYYFFPRDLTICPNMPPQRLCITISALCITNISVAKIPASLFTKSLIAIIIR